jgi:hypothetical protein
LSNADRPAELQFQLSLLRRLSIACLTVIFNRLAVPSALAAEATVASLQRSQAKQMWAIDTNIDRLLNASSSGAPVALIGQEGIRCAAPFRR